MTNFIKAHKKIIIAVATILVAALFGIYIKVLFTPGIWYYDTFLHQEDEGSFAGSDDYADYELHIMETETGSEIVFVVNEKVKLYQLDYDAVGGSVQIREDGALVLDGRAQWMSDSYGLVDSDSNWLYGIQVTADNVIANTEELFPTYNQLYNWAVAERYDIRGNFAMVFYIAIAGVFLALDIAFPNLFFTLKYRFAVEGGGPSDMYRSGQKFGRVLLVISIIVCVVMSFTTH